MKFQLFAAVAVFACMVEASQQQLEIPSEIVQGGGSITDLSQRIATWCRTTGQCEAFTSGDNVHSVSKRAATPVRDLCKFYGVKCKRSGGSMMAVEEVEDNLAKRSATQVRDLCKFYGVKCKRSGNQIELNELEDGIYDDIIENFLENCTNNTGTCNFLEYIRELNDEIIRSA